MKIKLKHLKHKEIIFLIAALDELLNSDINDDTINRLNLLLFDKDEVRKKNFKKKLLKLQNKLISKIEDIHPY